MACFPLFMLVLFKPFIFSFLILAELWIYCARRVRQKMLLVFTFTLTIFSTFLVAVAIFHHQFSQSSILIAKHFNSSSTLTRQNVFVGEFDYIERLFSGPIVSIVPVYPNELFRSVKHNIIFVEGIFCLIIVFYLIKKFCRYGYEYIIATTFLLLTCAAQYPVSIFNAGSATRYRVAILLALFCVLILIRRGGSEVHFSHRSTQDSYH